MPKSRFEDAMMTPAEAQDVAARGVLAVVRQRYADAFEHLTLIDAEDAYRHIDPRGDIPEPVVAHAKAWTKEYNLSCAAMDAAATRLASGEGMTWTASIPDHGIYLDARKHTQQEVLRQVRRAFNAERQVLKSLGYEPTPASYQRAHFVWLVDYCIGGLTFEEQASRQLECVFRNGCYSDPSAPNAKTISDGARKAATRIGLPWKRKPGPERGRRRQKPLIIVRRSL